MACNYNHCQNYEVHTIREYCSTYSFLTWGLLKNNFNKYKLYTEVKVSTQIEG